MPSIAITQAYEAAYIVDPGLGDEQIQPIVAKYRAVIENGGGTFEKVDIWERRRLAFEVKGRTDGIYIFMQFRSKPAVEAELRRIFQISEDQIRYLIIRRDDAEELLPLGQAAPAAPAAQPAPVAEPVMQTADQLAANVEDAPPAESAPAASAAPTAEATPDPEPAPIAEEAQPQQAAA